MSRPVAMRRRRTAVAFAALAVAMAGAQARATTATRSAPFGLRRAKQVYADLHRRLAAGPVSVGRSSGAAPAVTAVGAQQVSEDVIPPVQGSEPDTQQEPMIAVDPNDPNVVVAVFQEGRFTDIAAQAIGYATSQDAGRTWIHGELPGLTQAAGGPFERASDPVVAFGPDGAVYATTIALDEINRFRTAVTIQRSDDHGLTWGDPVPIRVDTNLSIFNDKEWLAVDTFPASPHFGRIYVGWDRIVGFSQPPVLSFSDDRGRTWSPVRRVSTTENSLGAVPLVHPNGDLTVIYPDIQSLTMEAQTSHDGGLTFGPVVDVDQCEAVDPPDQRDGGCIPSATVDPVTGTLYMAWTDARFRGDGLDDVVVTRSTDGVHWSPLVKVNPDTTGSGLEHMTAAVGANDHVVTVTYYVRHATDSGFGLIVRLRSSRSTDDGQTFGDELTIGPKINLTWAARASGLYFLGDYMGVAAASGSAHPVWDRSSRPPDDRTYHQATWTATIIP
jgi:hypothetical protein